MIIIIIIISLIMQRCAHLTVIVYMDEQKDCYDVHLHVVNTGANTSIPTE